MGYKKMYTKPRVQVERFDMDIEIATSLQGYVDFWKDMYKRAHGGQEPKSDDEFQEWLQGQPGYDNSSSGICYFTVGNS